METVRTPAQEKAYARWKEQEIKKEKLKEQRKRENTELFEQELKRKFSFLPEKDREKAIKKAKKNEHKKKSRPRARFVSGGLPSLGKR